jgi:hypothetical protein
MKTIYSLKEFHEKAVEIAKVESKLVSVRVELGLFGRYEFECYAEKKLCKGKTMEEALQKFHDAWNPFEPTKGEIDVEIEVEQETETI